MKVQSEQNLKKMRILVYVGLDRLGDGLLKLPFVQSLRKAFPDAHITWFAGKETSVYGGVLKSLVDGLIDEVVEFGMIGVHPSELLKPPAKGHYKGQIFDLIIDTQKIVWTSLSLIRLPHKKFISPAARFLLSSAKPNKGYRFPKSMQRQMLDLLELCSGDKFSTPSNLNIPIPFEMAADAENLCFGNKTSVALAPGAGGPPKCWPRERFIQIANKLIKQGFSVAFILGPQETQWQDELSEACPHVSFPLQNEWVQKKYASSPFFTMALAKQFTSGLVNDAGPAHLMAVGGLKLTVLYGPTVPEKFKPMGNDLTIIEAKTYGSREMTAIPFEDVYKAVLKKTMS